MVGQEHSGTACQLAGQSIYVDQGLTVKGNWNSHLLTVFSLYSRCILMASLVKVPLLLLSTACVRRSLSSPNPPAKAEDRQQFAQKEKAEKKGWTIKDSLPWITHLYRVSGDTRRGVRTETDKPVLATHDRNQLDRGRIHPCFLPPIIILPSTNTL